MIEAYNLKDFQKRLSKIFQIKLAVAIDLAKKGTSIRLSTVLRNLDWLYAFQGFFIGGGMNEPIIQPKTLMIDVIPV
ncbi:hypothetical protein [Paenibacillus jiagnxiensis]|uniref:hypothetical protein n=1 Tax=Paenibacillus jiagnxiensis TaxID=3228926 RepID=UPI0033B9D391